MNQRIANVARTANIILNYVTFANVNLFFTLKHQYSNDIYLRDTVATSFILTQTQVMNTWVDDDSLYRHFVSLNNLDIKKTALDKKFTLRIIVCYMIFVQFWNTFITHLKFERLRV